MTADRKSVVPPKRVPVAVQGLAWLLGVLACLAGMLNLIAEWDPTLATVQFLVLVIAPVVWMIERRHAMVSSHEGETTASSDRRAAWFAMLVGLTSLTTCFLVGRGMVDLPPAYHDEYSYLFQAKTLLSGAFSVPSSANMPELFDQMHVLNEGRMASRYYPGTGLWLAPWVLLGHPHWGHWFASALASVFVFWTGYELGRLRVAILSGMTCALSPGIALFANLLLAHQPTLVGLSLFVWMFVKWQRTDSIGDICWSGCGLSFAMLCRPATAAGVGLPFGLVFVYWLICSKQTQSPVRPLLRWKTVLALGIPLVIGWTVMLAYHYEVTGSWKTSPYQLYTDLYTPRHVYGFDNVVRGEQKVGPKVIESYDRWAVNLTGELAATNVRDRLLSSWLWTFDLIPLLLGMVVVVAMIPCCDPRWRPIGLAILSLHAIHIPYWYAGIMGWHYVFESALLWSLLLGLATDLLFRDWKSQGRWLMPWWWGLLLLVSLGGIYLPLRTLWVPTSGIPISGIPRIANATSSLRYPRRQYAEFDRWLNTELQRNGAESAMVLIEADRDDQHVDYVVNNPGLADPVLRARYRRGVTDLSAVTKGFPNRQIFLCHPKRKTIERITVPEQETGKP